MTTVDGGKAVDGAEIGVLILAVRFPRIPGDTGDTRTWPFPVRYRVVCCAFAGSAGSPVSPGTAVGIHQGWVRAGR